MKNVLTAYLLTTPKSVYTGNWVIEHILDFYKWLFNISYLWYALFAVIVLYTLLLQMLYNISYLWYALFAVIVLYMLIYKRLYNASYLW